MEKIFEWYLEVKDTDLAEEMLISEDFFNYAVENEADEKRIILYTDNEEFVDKVVTRLQAKIFKKNITYSKDWFRYLAMKPFRILNKVWIDPTGKFQVDDGIVIKMRPSAAFGTGDHPTTMLCAEFLERYLKNSCSVLDVGCGTAVLSIIAKKLGARKVTALDNDPVAVEVAQGFVRENNVEVDIIVSDLLNGVNGEYDIVVANIVTPVIIELLNQIHKVSKKGETVLIISGIPVKDEQRIVEEIQNKEFVILMDGEKAGWKVFAVKIC